MGRSLNGMVDLQDPKILAIIIFDIIGIGVFVWFLSSRLSLKLRVIEQRKERNRKQILQAEGEGQSDEYPVNR
ncbi:MAG: hypothetical protein VXY31_05005 [Candidatus Thermoplasmatota archaeon]|jgi:hypothetical protein|nr:hypothetical protein [Candidatus Thermoplasmatota archaeon]MED5306661.1 hypothetical protein [Candidatus Thermoplasmatota archaeon]|tara:strand:+ start:208 stop:426 length:219 start_codon:yes stop_codon:yes gene_type:complete